MMVVMVVVLLVVLVIMVIVMLVVTREWLRVGQRKEEGIVEGQGVPSQMISRPLAGSKDHQPPWKDPSATLQLLCRHAV